MRNRESGFWAVIFLLVCVAGFFMERTVISQAGSVQRAEKEMYRQMEREYLEETEKILEKSGFFNSGVNMTKTIDEEGERTYFLQIHNGRINALGKEEKDELLIKLKGVVFGDEACEFHHEFISADYGLEED